MRTTLQTLQTFYRQGRPITMVTAYDYTSALLVDAAEIPMILVGDSLGMVMQGHSSTLPVTIEDMVRYTSAVTRGASQAMVVADLPFLTYTDLASAVDGAGRLMREAGACAIKLEGAGGNLPIISRLVESGVPVMGHLGFTPQSEHQIGIRVQGKDAATAHKLMDDALALQAAGAFAVVLELVPADLAKAITDRLHIPTIGIGAGAGCSGQVQVWHDILGLWGEKPRRHAKVFANLAPVIKDALSTYRSEVENAHFPTKANAAVLAPEVLADVLATAPAPAVRPA
jgi:3-methyl-2-oxobutanoate hydroxymethyltransferase